MFHLRRSHLRHSYAKHSLYLPTAPDDSVRSVLDCSQHLKCCIAAQARLKVGNKAILSADSLLVGKPSHEGL